MIIQPDNEPLFAEQGVTEEITDEKYSLGWTGNPADWAFASYINWLFQKIDKKFNSYALSINGIIFKGVDNFNALYEYPVDSIITNNGKIYRARRNNTATPPDATDVGNGAWELVITDDDLIARLNLKADLESPALTGTPTTPNATGNEPLQIINFSTMQNMLNDRICGFSILDLSALPTTNSYPILFCKNDLPTDTLIYRTKGFFNANHGNMSFRVRGIGEGENKKNTSYLEVINLNDTSNSALGSFVNRIEVRANSPYIAVWLRGGTQYYVNQRERDLKYEILTANSNINGWGLNILTWDDSKILPDGTWSYTKPVNQVIDFSSIGSSNGQNTSLLGAVVYLAGTTPPLGALVADGSAISRTIYAKLFAYLGTRYGEGDSQTTFNLPDLRGWFIRGLDLKANIDTSTIESNDYYPLITDRGSYNGVGSRQLDAIPNTLTGWFDTSSPGTNSPGSDNTLFVHSSVGKDSPANSNAGRARDTFTPANVTRVNNENLVKNIALLPCIYYI